MNLTTPAAPAGPVVPKLTFPTVKAALDADLPTVDFNGEPARVADATFRAEFIGNKAGGILTDRDQLLFPRGPGNPVLKEGAYGLPATFWPDVLKGAELLHESGEAWKPGDAPLSGTVDVTGRLYDQGDGQLRFTATSVDVQPAT